MANITEMALGTAHCDRCAALTAQLLGTEISIGSQRHGEMKSTRRQNYSGRAEKVAWNLW